MSKKFSIIETINFDKLDREINEYIQNSNTKPYIFMNEGTAKAIEFESEINNLVIDDTLSNKIKSGVYGEYRGYKIFINNYLNFGVVEIK